MAMKIGKAQQFSNTKTCGSPFSSSQSAEGRMDGRVEETILTGNPQG
jgi:hypothetical protein